MFLFLFSLSVISAADEMICADVCGTSYCGILTLERGEGTKAPYQHPTPVVHGLWPQNSPYGDSRCYGADPKAKVFNLACYTDASFAQHEWSKHGYCAAKTPDDYLKETCALSVAPLTLMAASRKAGKKLPDVSKDLTAAGYTVWATNAYTDEVQLVTCAGADVVWSLKKSSALMLHATRSAASVHKIADELHKIALNMDGGGAFSVAAA